MGDADRVDEAEARRRWVAGRLLHEIDRLASIPGPLTEGDAFRAAIDRRVAAAAGEWGGTPEEYRRAFVAAANHHGWDLAEDGSNWDDRWRAYQAAGRRRARWAEIRDALDDLE